MTEGQDLEVKGRIGQNTREGQDWVVFGLTLAK